MTLSHRLAQIATMSPGDVLRKAARHLARQAGRRLLGRALRRQCTYPASQPGFVLARRLAPLDPATLAGMGAWVSAEAAQARRHRFDLLGSGPVTVAYGLHAEGFGAHRYGPGPAIPPQQDWRDWIAAQAWPANVDRARLLLGLIDDDAYVPIDWHVDFISGYRWSPRVFGPATPYGHRPGVDVKVPWELARLQHLPVLALAHAQGVDGGLADEFRHQVLDFLAANPPGWGVNWACPMDVSIRAVNILLARDLFLAHGAAWDDEFESELAAAMLAHLRHVAANLEWNPEHRGNHYLADICGLAWMAAYLPPSEETDILLVFAVQQLDAEIRRQFDADGANFEASTAYHRLSAEMALYTVALVLGLPPERRQVLAGYDHRLWKRRPALRPGPMAWPPFGEDVLPRLAGAARFAVACTKPSGEMIQVGDNDSGRFVRLSEGGELDSRHLADAAAGLMSPAVPPPAGGGLETAVIRGLSGLAEPLAVAPPRDRETWTDGPAVASVASRAVRVVITPADPAALRGMRRQAYGGFGLFIWRNERAFVAVRCGPIGQNGQGGHAHNDQLAVEVEIDRVAYARDPGTFVYTADLAARNAYRSALAHFVPRHGDAEPATLAAPFRLEDRARAQTLRFDDDGFLGCHHGFGETVWRRVRLTADSIEVEDLFGGTAIGAATAVTEHRVTAPQQLAALWNLTLPFSPGYGRRAATPDSKAAARSP